MVKIDYAIFKSFPISPKQNIVTKVTKVTKECDDLAKLLGHISFQDNVIFKDFQSISTDSRPDFMGFFGNGESMEKVYVELTLANMLPTSLIAGEKEIDVNQINRTAISVTKDVRKCVSGFVRNNERINVNITFIVSPQPDWKVAKSLLCKQIRRLIIIARSKGEDWSSHLTEQIELLKVGIKWISFSYFVDSDFPVVNINANEFDLLERNVIEELNNAIKRKEEKNYSLDAECWLCIKVESDFSGDFEQINQHKFSSNFFKRVYLLEDLDQYFGMKRIV